MYVNKLQGALERLVAKVEVTTTNRVMSGFAGVRERTCWSRLQRGNGSHGVRNENAERGKTVRGPRAKEGKT